MESNAPESQDSLVSYGPESQDSLVSYGPESQDSLVSYGPGSQIKVYVIPVALVTAFKATLLQNWL